MIKDFFKKIMRDFSNKNNEASQNSPDNNDRERVVLIAGKYVGGIDIAVGVYNIKILSGDGSVDTEDVSKNDDKYVSVGLCMPGKLHNGINAFPQSYNGLEIRSKMIVKIWGTARIEFCLTRKIAEESELSIEDLTHDVYAQSRSEANNFYKYRLDSMDGWQFESFCANILKRNGYKNVEVTRGSGDQGVDVLAERDGIRYAVQCKHYSKPVGNKSVQEIFAGKQFYHCHVGIAMTNNYFTQSAKELARESGIILWDRDFLNRFMCENYCHEPFLENSVVQVEREEKRLIEDEIVEDKKGRKEEMYDREKGIYPPGIYVVGEDIEIGKYLLNAKKGDGKDPMVTFYENYSKYRKEEINQLERFDDDYYLSLREIGMVIAVRDADIKKL